MGRCNCRSWGGVIVAGQISNADGLDVLQRLRTAAPKTRIVCLATHPAPERAYVLFGAGAVGLVPKEDSSTELLPAIHAAATGISYLSPRLGAELASRMAGREARSVVGENDRGDQERLSPREREILGLIAQGLSYAAVALQLGISERTVESHRQNIGRKLHAHSLADLIRHALREGLTTLD
jgi:DNA-binding NarL/FixJ family response regulator